MDDVTEQISSADIITDNTDTQESRRDDLLGESLVPEPLGTKETESIIQKLYDHLGPELGSHFVEANIVLTIAGARGQTEFFISNPSDDVRAKLLKANELLKDHGISLNPGEETFKSASTGVRTLMVGIYSLRGYERVSKISQIPGIKPYDSKSGFDGLSAWVIRVWRAMEKAQSEGEIPYDRSYLPDIFAGIVKGYPDVAIYDLCEWDLDKDTVEVVSSQIDNVSLYGGAEPNFDYKQEHRGDPSIVTTVNEWGKSLGDFYEGSWHQQIKNDPEFIQARNKIQ